MLTATAKTGYRFTGWSGDATGSTNPYTLTMTKNMMVAANFVKRFTISYDGNNKTSGSVPSTGTYDSNTTVIVSTNTGSLQREGFNFNGWNTNSGGTGIHFATGTGTFTISADVALFAEWTVAQYQVTFNTYGGTSVTSQTVNSGSHATEPTSTRSGLTLVGWYRESGYTNRWNFSTQTVTGPITLHAKWEVRDIDGNAYDTVRIGSQTWMKQNLKTTRYNNGDSIKHVPDSAAWSNCIVAAYCWPGNYATVGVTYGAVYNGYAANMANIAPLGWHVPTEDDFRQFYQYLESIYPSPQHPEYAMMAVGTFPEATNSSGFTGLSTPGRFATGSFFDVMSIDGAWWTTSNNAFIVNNTYMPYWFPGYDKTFGLSIRCIKD
jgi:uncharacterized protein (TIGR02145 family)/uncharacterized repeat protein (TIGR02543 family)